MTNELEKQFFQCFGIEPKPLFSTRNGYTDDKYIYPQITDRILLELICILDPYCYSSGKNIQHLKESVLDWCIKYKEDIKHQVHTLFEDYNNDR